MAEPKTKAAPRPKPEMVDAAPPAPLPDTVPVAMSELGRLQAQVSTRRVALADLERTLGERTRDLNVIEKKAGERLVSVRERSKAAEAALAQAHAELDEVNKAVSITDAGHRRLQAQNAFITKHVAEAEARLAVLQQQIKEEAAVEARLEELAVALGTHERAANQSLANLEAIKAEEKRLNGIIANAQEAHTRRGAALQEREDVQAGDAAQLAHNKQLLEQYAAEMEQRDLDLNARESGLVTARADAETAFDQIRAERQQLAAEATRLGQMKKALDVVEDEITKTRQSAQEALAQALAARAEAEARSEALERREKQTEAGWLGVRNAERGVESRIADLDAREQRLRSVSLKLAAASAEMKQAIVKQKLEGAGIVVPDVEV